MQEEDLRQVADELYALSPDDFRPARDERAGQARASGDSELARAIAALRRPAVSAWLVNRLAREAPGQVADLVALGESLRAAQRDLAGDRLRELSTRRGKLTTALVNEAKRVAAQAGRPVSPQVEREVEATLSAALADPDAAAEVSAGCLAGPLAYAGLGAGEAAAPARRAGAREPKQAAAAAERKHDGGRTVPATGTARRGSGTRRTAAEREADQAAQREAREAAREAAAAERREREAAAARAAVQDAAGAVAAAGTDLDEAEQNAASARKRQETLRRRAEELDRELAEALAEESRANRTFRDAQRGREAAAQALDAARKRLAKAEQAARKLTDG